MNSCCDDRVPALGVDSNGVSARYRLFALIRPHEIGLLPGPGPAYVASVHVTGPLTRVHLRLAEQDVDVLRQLDAWAPAVGETCNLDLSRARIYPLDVAAGRIRQVGAAR